MILYDTIKHSRQIAGKQSPLTRLMHIGIETWKSHGKVMEKYVYMEKSRKIYKKQEYVEMNKLTLNTNKTELIFFSRDNSDFGSIFYKNEILTTQKSCRYLGIQIARILSFEEQLNKTLKKMAHAIRSIYPTRHQVPLNARILLKSLVLSHLSFSATFFFSKFICKKPKTP